LSVFTKKKLIYILITKHGDGSRRKERIMLMDMPPSNGDDGNSNQDSSENSSNVQDDGPSKQSIPHGKVVNKKIVSSNSKERKKKKKAERSPVPYTPYGIFRSERLRTENSWWDSFLDLEKGLCQCAYNIVHNWAEAQDIVIDAGMGVIKRLEDGDLVLDARPNAFRAYLYTSVRNLAWKRNRALARFISSDEGHYDKLFDYLDKDPHHTNIGDVLNGLETANRYQEKAEELYRRLLVYVKSSKKLQPVLKCMAEAFFQGEAGIKATPAELAARLNMSEKTYKRYVVRVQNILKKSKEAHEVVFNDFEP
jgi:DNA-directed RNA polymerase specialized sigma24 family protein